MDFWSNRQMQSFLVVTGQFFKKDGHCLQSTVLNFSTFDKRHTSIEISETIQTKLSELNILQKVVCITCDGAKNMIRAVDDMHFNLKRIWCVAHRLHLTITNAFGFWLKKKETEADVIVSKKKGI